METKLFVVIEGDWWWFFDQIFWLRSNPGTDTAKLFTIVH